MYLTGHAAIGITLASVVGATNPVAAFGIGWLSHYLADFFPHGDEGVGEWIDKGKGLRRLLAIVAIDGVITLSAFAILSANRGFSWALAAAAVGSFVPDVLWGLEKLFGRKLFGPHEKFHHWNHNFFHVMIPSRYGVPLQVVFCAVLWTWLTVR